MQEAKSGAKQAVGKQAMQDADRRRRQRASGTAQFVQVGGFRRANALLTILGGFRNRWTNSSLQPLFLEARNIKQLIVTPL
jgi:hypothetical protein